MAGEMEKIIISNQLGEIKLDDDLILMEIDGLGTPDSTTNTSKSPFQDGTTKDNVYFENRTIDMRCALLTNNEIEKYEKIRTFGKILNPKFETILTIITAEKSKKLIGQIEFMQLPSGSSNKHRNYQVLNLSFTAFQPFLQDIEETVIELTNIVKNFEFPLQFPTEFGIILNNKVNINNNSSINVPLIFEVYGRAENVKLTNETTKEFIKINSTIPVNNVLKINTEFGHKEVVLIDEEGNQTNQFNLIDLESIFFSLIPGNNTILFTADTSTDTTKTNIKFINRYLTI